MQIVNDLLEGFHVQKEKEEESDNNKSLEEDENNTDDDHKAHESGGDLQRVNTHLKHIFLEQIKVMQD